MASLPLDTKELPRDWRRTLTLIALLVLGGAAGIGSYLGVEVIAGKAAKTAAHQAIAESLQEIRVAALTAAREGAAQAVRENYEVMSNRIYELDKREAKHEGVDDQRQIEVERRIQTLEGRIR